MIQTTSKLEEQLANICRICLCEVVVKESKNIFTDQSMLNLLEDIVPKNIKIRQNDKLPKNVCPKCTDQIKIIEAFRKKIVESDNYLRSKLQSICKFSGITEIEDNEDASLEKPQNSKPTSVLRLRTDLSELFSSSISNEHEVCDPLAEHDPLAEENDYQVVKKLLKSSISDSIILTNDGGNKSAASVSKDKPPVTAQRPIFFRSKNVVPPETPKLFECQKCERTFSNMAYLERHIEYHELEVIELESDDSSDNINARLPAPSKQLLDKTQQSNSSNGISRVTLNKPSTVNNNVSLPTPSKPTQQSNSSNGVLRAAFKKPSTVTDSINNIDSEEKCKHCDRMFPVTQLSWHMYLAHKIESELPPDVIVETCVYCKIELPPYSRRKHVRECHAAEYRKERMKILRDKHTCSKCGKQFLNRRALMTHISRHEPKFNCTVCSEAFFTYGSLTKHLKIVHKSTEKSLCYICGNMYATSFLHIHHKTHSKKTLKCPEEGCKAVLKYERSLRKHKLRKHGTNQLKFMCEHCGKAFCFSDSFRRHLIVHKDTKKFRNICPICKRKYYTSRGLKMHMNLHLRKKSFSCPLCSRLFAYEPFMRKHMIDFHPDYNADLISPLITDELTHQSDYGID